MNPCFLEKLSKVFSVGAENVDHLAGRISQKFTSIADKLNLKVVAARYDAITPDDLSVLVGEDPRKVYEDLCDLSLGNSEQKRVFEKTLNNGCVIDGFYKAKIFRVDGETDLFPELLDRCPSEEIRDHIFAINKKVIMPHLIDWSNRHGTGLMSNYD